MRTRTQSPGRRHTLVAAMVGAALVLGGCISVPTYDAKTDEMLTSLQSDADEFFAHLSDTYDATAAGGKACAYAANRQSYQSFRLTLGLLRTRAAALYNDQATSAALAKLTDTFDKLEAAHEEANNRADHCIIPPLLPADQQAIDDAIGSVMKLELAKKGSI